VLLQDRNGNCLCTDCQDLLEMAILHALPSLLEDLTAILTKTLWEKEKYQHRTGELGIITPPKIPT